MLVSITKINGNEGAPNWNQRYFAFGENSTLNFSGLERYLNSNLPIVQVTLKFCLPGALAHLPKFSNSLIGSLSSNYSDAENNDDKK